MPNSRTYLDHNASSPLRPEARAAMLAALDLAGNASSVHAEGRAARALIEEARAKVAALAGAEPGEVVFTSGGTEADNWVLAGPWTTLLLSTGLEHDAVVAPARASSARLVELAVGADGRAGLESFEASAGHVEVYRDSASSPLVGEGRGGGDGGGRAELGIARIATAGIPPTPNPSRQGGGEFGPALLSLQLANNETGVVQPVGEFAAIARSEGIAVHTDAVQAAGRIPIDMRALGVDFLSLSAHKLGGPKGIGALIIRDGRELPACVTGGGQEQRRRAGTENVAAIAGFGAAAEAALRDLARADETRALRDRLEREALAITPAARIIGSDAPRLPNTTCLALPGASAETLVIGLDLAGIAVSAGAACSSGKVASSRVLTAMGLGDDLARSAIRISLGWSTTAADIDTFIAAWSRLSAMRTASRRKVA